MEAKQFDAMIADAEVRLKRLRVLYDQWFAGIERVEPQQQRDRFERLLKTLQREPTANTAVRFRIQQLQQRYTTYSTYWKRITRQIEEGTYRRDVLKAKRRREARQEDDAPQQREAFELDLDIELDMDSALDDALASVMTPSAQPAAANTTVAFQSGSAIGGALASGVGAAAGSAAAVSSVAAAGASPSMSGGSASRRFPRPPGVGPVTGRPATAAAASVSTHPGAAAGIVDRVAPVTGAVAGAPVPHRPQVPSATVLPHPSTSASPGSGPRVATVKRAAAARPKPAPVAAKLPSADKPTARTAQRAAGSHAAVSDQEIKRIYDRYIAARKQNAERTDNVRVESIAKSVRGMMPKLAKKHAGKQIDFEVVLRGGKVALKPVAK